MRRETSAGKIVEYRLDNQNSILGKVKDIIFIARPRSAAVHS
jgi:hypothetical protein